MSQAFNLSSSRERTFITDRVRLRITATVLFIIILVLHGTYLRIRPNNEIPTLDWVVLARVLACGAGAVVGLMMIPRGMSWGIGAKLLLAYALASVFSALPSDYLVTSLGYSLLLLGVTLLMIGMTYSASTIEQVRRIERVWIITVALMTAKDALTGLLMPADPIPGEVVRMGMGLTHANQLSLHAVVLFWFTFGIVRPRFSALIWLLRGFCVFVLLSAVSRGSIMAFILGGLVFTMVRGNRHLDRGILLSVGMAAALSLFFLGLSFGQGWSDGILDYLVRGQDRGQITSLTGRTDIWKHALSKVRLSPIYGHGYGVSRFVMSDMQALGGFTPAHTHNSFLEVFVSSGIMGMLPFLLLVFYSLRWFTRYPRLKDAMTPEVAVHGAMLIVMLIPVIMIETALAARITPMHGITFLYLLLLDREDHFRTMREMAFRFGPDGRVIAGDDTEELPGETPPPNLRDAPEPAAEGAA